MPSLDPALVLATLTDVERKVVDDWTSTVALEDPYDCPPLKSIVELVAVLRVASEVPLSGAGDRIRAAAEALGMEDDGERATHPGDRFVRKLRGWSQSAQEPPERVSAHASAEADRLGS